MEIILSRYFQNDAVTFGMLHIKGIKHWPLFTLENPWKNNRRDVSCIPRGTYDCASYSGTIHKNVYRVLNVKNRGCILFHVGNWEHETKGCILPGTGTDPDCQPPMVMHSANAMNQLRKIIKHQPFTLEIKRFAL